MLAGQEIGTAGDFIEELNRLRAKLFILLEVLKVLWYPMPAREKFIGHHTILQEIYELKAIT